MRPICKQEFLEYRRKKRKNNAGKTVYGILADVMEPMIERNHPMVKEVIANLKVYRCYSNKDWIAAILSELGAIEYSSCTRLKNINSRPRKSAIVSICILLGVDLGKSMELLGAAGHKLRDGNDIDDAYSFLIEKRHIESQDLDNIGRLSYYSIIEEYNEILFELVKTVKTLDRLGPIPKQE